MFLSSVVFRVARGLWLRWLCLALLAVALVASPSSADARAKDTKGKTTRKARAKPNAKKSPTKRSRSAKAKTAKTKKSRTKKSRSAKTAKTKKSRAKSRRRPQSPSKAKTSAKPKPYVAPRRTVAQIAWAIEQSNPRLPKHQRLRLAQLLVEIAKKNNFDALSGWAIIDHESDWRAHAVSADGEDIGLAQVRYTVSRACQKDRTSEACLARKEALLDPVVNIRAMAGAITAWRKLCVSKTGRPANIQNWLAGYGGYSKPRLQRYCGRQRVKTKRGTYRWKELPVPKAVMDIVVARREMAAKLRKRRVR